MNIKILDTNVLIYKQTSLFDFPNNLIILPSSVIKELDKFKTDPSKGPGVRYVNRILVDAMSQEKVEITIDGEKETAYPLKNGSFLKIEMNSINNLPDNFPKDDSMDNRILSVAYTYSKKFKNVEFITNDISLRIQAISLDIKSYEYEGFIQQEDESIYKGFCEQILLKDNAGEKLIIDESLEAKANEYFLVKKSEDKKDKKFTYKYNQKEKSLILVQESQEDVMGVYPKNKEQFFALDALLDPRIPLVAISGKAGTGKTLLAIAAGLRQVLEENKYQKILISRPTVSLPNNELGFLPGDINDKMFPWLKPIFDNLDYLFSQNGEKTKSYQTLLEQKILEVEPLAFIRGRSIPKQFMIIDEAQNLSPHEIKTIITRAGTDTKIVLTGDPGQIDSPYLNALNNGLTQLIEKMKDKGEGLFAHIQLEQGERSPLAELAANVLD